MKINNRVALDEIMLSHEKTQALVSEVKRLALDVFTHKTKGDIISDDIKATAESLGITNSKLNELIKAYNGNLESALGEMSSTVDVFEILEELEKVIKHCNALIERNTVEMGGV